LLDCRFPQVGKQKVGLNMAKDSKRKKVAAETGIYLIVIVAIAAVANILSAGSTQRFDTTKNERFTLSQGSGRMVKNLKEPMLVDAYVTRGLAKLESYIDDLNSLLTEYERVSDGKFKFTIIEAKTEELREQAKEAGLQPMTFAAQAETGEDQAAIASGYLGLVLKYGSEKAAVPLMPGYSEGLEFQLTMKIRELRDKADSVKHKIGVLTGKDELKLSDTNLTARRGQGGPNIRAIIDQYFPFYEFVDVDLKDGAEAIDESLGGLVITQPQKDFTDKELRRIDQFVMRGGKALAVFASAVNVKASDPKMEAELDTHELDKLLAGYGINLKADMLLDFGAQFQTPVPTQAGIAVVRHPPVAHVVNDPSLEGDKRLLDTGFATFFHLEEAAFPYPSTLELMRDKQPPDVKLSVVARTTPNTTELTFEGKKEFGVKLEGWEQKPDPKQHVIAAVAKGKLKSAFAGTGDNQGVETAEQAPEDSKVLVVSSSQFLTNPFAYSGNGPELGGQFAMMGNVGGDPTLLAISDPYAKRYLTNTILAFKNTLDWITGDEDLLEVSAKIIGDANLKYSNLEPPKMGVSPDEVRRIDEQNKKLRRLTQQKLEWTLTLGIPFLFGAFGVFRWRSRLNRRSSLKL
jgi:ABC-type uncharacterized transport system involved in gliding motility auxiliary subunit